MSEKKAEKMEKEVPYVKGAKYCKGQLVKLKNGAVAEIMDPESNKMLFRKGVSKEDMANLRKKRSGKAKKPTEKAK